MYYMREGAGQKLLISFTVPIAPPYQPDRSGGRTILRYSLWGIALKYIIELQLAMH